MLGSAADGALADDEDLAYPVKSEIRLLVSM